ncbi:MAG: thioredoxin family protein [Gammaproteobacteria bacterium]|nr:thioredoxin family protein [Gammaproteobacteria bacterium]
MISLFPGQALLAQTGLDNLPQYSVIYDPQRDPYQDGRAAIKLAQASNRQVLIEVGGDWCSWCHILDRFLEQNPDIKQKLHQTFVMLKVNVSDSNDNHQFLAAFPRPLGYPHMYIAGKDGDILLSKDTADFLNNGKYSRQQFLDFFSQWAVK